MTDKNEEKGTNKSNALSLPSKLAAIADELGSVKQDGRNQHAGYNYISYEQLNARLTPLLNKYHVVIIPSFESITERDIQSGSRTWTRTVVTGTETIYDGDSEKTIHSRIVGADQDVGGKSAAQAITEAHKRFLLKLFNITSKGDIDPDSRTVQHPGNYSPTQARNDYPERVPGAHVPVEQVAPLQTPSPDVPVVTFKSDHRERIANNNQSAHTTPKINDKQRRDLIETARNNGWSDEQTRAMVTAYGYKTTADITEDVFDTIKIIFQSAPQDPA